MTKPLNPADDAFAERLHGLVPPAAFRPCEPRYLEERRGRFRGQPGLVLAPGTTDETAAIVKAAAKARVAIVPYGGGTGLVGGQVLPEGPAPVILSLERMTRIRGIWPDENVMSVEAGAILADVQGVAREAERLFPLALASEGSARIGGLMATNAGGLNVLRYGTARELCLGVEAVLPDGSIWHGLKRLRKDNTGYDLRGLLVGSEGTLGVITAANLRLFPLPARRATALVVIDDPAAALALLNLATARLGQAISAFELISGQGLRFLVETGCGARAPFADIPTWSVLIEIETGPGQDPDAELAALFEAAEELRITRDGVTAQSEAQRGRLWNMREEIPEANKRVGAVSSHDVSLPISSIPKFLDAAEAALAALGPYRLNAFGHLGDGNLHVNVFPPAGHKREEFAEARDTVATAIHDLVDAHDGSIAAEHGVGRLKVAALAHYGDPAKLAAMRAIKQALDPQGIMNPGAIFAAGA